MTTEAPGISVGHLRRLVVGHGLAATAMSMPWPALLAATWTSTHSELWLGVVGAARMAPYVLLSWAAGALGDRVSRTKVLQVSTAARAVLLIATAVSFGTGQLLTSIILATLVVGMGTPAYPALAAAMPATAGSRNAVATNWLVVLEVSAFVVGPAVGGLLLGFLGEVASVYGAAVLGVIAGGVIYGLRLASVVAEPAEDTGGMLSTLMQIPAALRVISSVALINIVDGAVGVALLPLAIDGWNTGDREFGWATAAFGFGALAAPVLQRVLRLSPTAMAAAMLLSGIPLLLVAATPTVLWAIVPLALLGAAATQVECAATNLLQVAVPDHVRSFALGFTDGAMVAAALVGALLAPWLSGLLGPRVLLVLLAVGVLLIYLGLLRPHRR